MYANLKESGIYEIVRGPRGRRGAWIVHLRDAGLVTRTDGRTTFRMQDGLTFGASFYVVGGAQQSQMTTQCLVRRQEPGSSEMKLVKSITAFSNSSTDLLNCLYTIHPLEEVKPGRWCIELWGANTSSKLAEAWFTIDPAEAVKEEPTVARKPILDRIPPHVRAAVEGRPARDLEKLEQWVQRGFAAGLPKESVAETVVASGWAAPFADWIVSEVQSSPIREEKDNGGQLHLREMPWRIFSLRLHWVLLALWALASAVFIRSGDWSAARWFGAASLYCVVVSQSFCYSIGWGAALSLAGIPLLWMPGPGSSYSTDSDLFFGWLVFGVFASAAHLVISQFDRSTFQNGGFYDYVRQCPNCHGKAGRWRGALGTTWMCSACGSEVSVGLPWGAEARRRRNVRSRLPDAVASLVVAKPDSELDAIAHWISRLCAAGYADSAIRQRVLELGWPAQLVDWLLARSRPAGSEAPTRRNLPAHGEPLTRRLLPATAFLGVYFLFLAVASFACAMQYLSWSYWSWVLAVIFSAYSLFAARAVAMRSGAVAPLVVAAYLAWFILVMPFILTPRASDLNGQPQPPDTTGMMTTVYAVLLLVFPAVATSVSRKSAASSESYGLVGICPACLEKKRRHHGFLWTSWTCAACGCSVDTLWPWRKAWWRAAA